MEVSSSELIYEKELGQGSFGVVYRGRWRYVPVAIKNVRVVSRNYVEDLLKEATVMLSLRPHPNVVSFLGICNEPQHYAIITEYLEGGSLDCLLYSQAPFSLLSGVRILLDVAMGVAHLHQEKIVHRDIAARNVLLTADLRAKISDFGFAKVVERHQQESPAEQVTGAVRWMAPEALTLHAYSIASDVWSFGILCFEVASRSLPFKDVETHELATEIALRSLTPKMPSSAPPALSALASNCWQRSMPPVFPPPHLN